VIGLREAQRAVEQQRSPNLESYSKFLEQLPSLQAKIAALSPAQTPSGGQTGIGATAAAIGGNGGGANAGSGSAGGPGGAVQNSARPGAAAQTPAPSCPFTSAKS
jgi:hypothetical protein